MRYEITENLEVRAWATDAMEDAPPVLFQPHWPDGTAWANRSEAETWVQQWILSNEDPTADLAGDSPDAPIRPRPSVEDQPIHFTTTRELNEMIAAAIAKALSESR